jgi:hypothetical protein
MAAFRLPIQQLLGGSGGFLVWFLAVAGVLAFTARPDSTKLHEDEVYWIGSAYYYRLAFVDCDYSHPDWTLLPARENPPVAKYLIGVATEAAGYGVTTPDLLGAFYLLFSQVIPASWGGPHDQAKRSAVVNRMLPAVRENVTAGKRIEIPSSALLWARCAMVLCVSVASLSVFLVGRSLLGGTAALAASVMFPLHPIAKESANHVFADAPALMFSGVAIVMLITSLRLAVSTRETFGRTVCLPFFSGAVAGLACATKMNAMIILAVAFVGFGVLLVRRFRSSAKLLLRQPAIAAFTYTVAALAAFVAVNPTLYGDVWSGLWALVDEHRRSSEIQAAFLTGRLASMGERFSAVGQLVGLNRWIMVPLPFLAVMLLKYGSDRHRFIAGWWIVALLAVGMWIPYLRLRYAAPLLMPTLLLVFAAADFFYSRWHLWRGGSPSGSSAC